MSIKYLFSRWFDEYNATYGSRVQAPTKIQPTHRQGIILKKFLGMQVIGKDRSLTMEEFEFHQYYNSLLVVCLDAKPDFDILT